LAFKGTEIIFASPLEVLCMPEKDGSWQDFQRSFERTVFIVN
jgi:hypothetical protein